MQQSIVELGSSFLTLPLSENVVGRIEAFLNMFLLLFHQRINRFHAKRIDVQLLMTVLCCLFTDQLLVQILEHGHKALEEQTETQIMFERSDFSASCCTYISGVLTYLCTDILQLCEIEALAHGSSVITTKHFFKAMFDDPEWKCMMERAGIRFITTAVHPRHYVSTKPHILRWQQKSAPVLPRQPFCQLLQSILQHESFPVKISKSGVDILRTFIEQDIVDYLITVRKHHPASKIHRKHLV